jgi:hypothetical protein
MGWLILSHLSVLSPGHSALVKEGGRSSVVEFQPSKLAVAGSNPVARSMLERRYSLNVTRWNSTLRQNHPAQFLRLTNNEDAHVAQLAEHVLGKDEVTRSIRVVGSMTF